MKCTSGRFFSRITIREESKRCLSDRKFSDEHDGTGPVLVNAREGRGNRFSEFFPCDKLQKRRIFDIRATSFEVALKTTRIDISVPGRELTEPTYSEWASVMPTFYSEQSIYLTNYEQPYTNRII